MEREKFQNEINIAVILLLCLWFKLDATMEYAASDIPLLMYVSCGILISIILMRTLWLLFTNAARLLAIIKGVLKSEMFDAISWIPFLMLFANSERYAQHLACAAWVLGDIVMLGGLFYLYKRLQAKQKDDYEIEIKS